MTSYEDARAAEEHAWGTLSEAAFSVAGDAWEEMAMERQAVRMRYYAALIGLLIANQVDVSRANFERASAARSIGRRLANEKPRDGLRRSKALLTSWRMSQLDQRLRIADLHDLLPIVRDLIFFPPVERTCECSGAEGEAERTCARSGAEGEAERT